MGKIILKNVRCYSFHGCLKEESIVGSDYLVNLKVWSDLKKSAGSDELADTIDYVLLNYIIKTEMSKPSKLLETVAQRINEKIFQKEPRVTKSVVTSVSTATLESGSWRRNSSNIASEIWSHTLSG